MKNPHGKNELKSQRKSDRSIIEEKEINFLFCYSKIRNQLELFFTSKYLILSDHQAIIFNIDKQPESYNIKFNVIIYYTMKYAGTSILFVNI